MGADAGIWAPSRMRSELLLTITPESNKLAVSGFRGSEVQARTYFTIGDGEGWKVKMLCGAPAHVERGLVMSCIASPPFETRTYLKIV